MEWDRARCAPSADHEDPHGTGGEDRARQERWACVVFSIRLRGQRGGTVSAVLSKEDFIISDQLNHASIIDGARSRAPRFSYFNHKDIAHAENNSPGQKDQPGRKLLISDGVFSWTETSARCRNYAIWRKRWRDHDG